ncbi:hypothetical protein ABJY94_18405 [Vibrio parahaemolyticus]|uniref:hypothetical protein n=1 Tax=Vibrio parahaemolyticus TaxID=670 RepID=UPI0032AECF12
MENQEQKLLTPLRVIDENGETGMLVGIDSTRQNPFKIESLKGGEFWYCRNVNSVQ